MVAEISPVAPQLLDARTRGEIAARVGVAQANRARAQAAITRAQSALEFARDQAVRTRTLFSQNGASKQALEQAEYQQRAAEAEHATAQLGERVAAGELDAAQAALASMRDEAAATLELVAPVRGQVLRVFQESEAWCRPAHP